MINIFTFILLCFCSSIVCAGVYIAIHTSTWLTWYKRLIDNLPEFLYKPLGYCLPCMASLWGMPVYLYLYYVLHINLSMNLLPMALIVISALNYYLWVLIPEDKE